MALLDWLDNGISMLKVYSGFKKNRILLVSCTFSTAPILLANQRWLVELWVYCFFRASKFMVEH